MPLYDTITGLKTCGRCRAAKDLSCYSGDKQTKDGFANRCKKCRSEERQGERSRETPERKAKRLEWFRVYMQKARDKDPEHHSGFARWKRYKLTVAQYRQMRDAQDGKCAICLRVPSGALCVDHCHATKQVRQLLCRKCNSAIGYLDDNPDAMRRAADYVQGHREAVLYAVV